MQGKVTIDVGEQFGEQLIQRFRVFGAHVGISTDFGPLKILEK
jgi:hypothetical protein